MHLWNKELEKSFGELKKQLVFAPILTLLYEIEGYQFNKDA